MYINYLLCKPVRPLHPVWYAPAALSVPVDVKINKLI